MSDNSELEEAKAQAKKAQREAAMWRKIARMAFTMHNGCLDGCRRGMMCTCGYMMYSSYLLAEESGTV